MSMNAGDTACTAGLSKEIHDLILSGDCGAVEGLKLKALSNAIASAVVSHIKANAVVNPTALLAPPGTAGGPVTGTGTIT